MSELKEECYKCLNNQSCISGADYGSMYCMLHRKYKMQGDNEDSIYAIKFAAMQEQIKEKDKRIAELEEELENKNNKIWQLKETIQDLENECLSLHELIDEEM